MKSDRDLLIVLVVVGIAGYLLYANRAQLAGGPTERERLMSIIGNLAPDPRFLPKQDKLTLTQGILSGSTTGLAFGPIGAGVGAAGGAVASFFL